MAVINTQDVKTSTSLPQSQTYTQVHNCKHTLTLRQKLLLDTGVYFALIFIAGNVYFEMSLRNSLWNHRLYTIPTF